MVVPKPGNQDSCQIDWDCPSGPHANTTHELTFAAGLAVGPALDPGEVEGALD